MKKNRIREYIVLAALLIVFSVISFAVPVPRKTIFWLAYVFGLFAILYQVYMIKISGINEGAARSRFYGFPIVRIGILYLTAQMAVSLLEIVLQVFLPVWVVVIINVILAALAVAGCVVTDAMRDEIVRQDVRLKKDVANMRKLQSMSAGLVSQCSGYALQEKLQSLADEFKYSDPVTCDDSQQMEQDIAVLLDELQKAIIDNDDQSAETLCVRISGSLGERNRICKLHK